MLIGTLLPDVQAIALGFLVSAYRDGLQDVDVGRVVADRRGRYRRTE
jgi:hypothetical protein